MLQEAGNVPVNAFSYKARTVVMFASGEVAQPSGIVPVRRGLPTKPMTWSVLDRLSPRDVGRVPTILLLTNTICATSGDWDNHSPAVANAEESS